MLVAESVVCSKIICELIECQLIVQGSVVELTLEGCCLHFFKDDVDSDLGTSSLEDQGCCLLEFLVDHDVECKLAWLVAGESQFFLGLLKVVFIDMDVFVETELSTVDVVVVDCSKAVICCEDDG